MTGVVLFGGTTEGRQLAQALDGLCAARGLPLTVFVATEYGQEVLPALTHGQVHTGRLAPEAMADQMAGCQLIIDATHPYAETVSASLRAAAKAAGVPLWRCSRPASALPERCICLPDAPAAAEWLARQEGRVLLTTGAKELPAFAALPPERLYARVLATHDGIAACEQAGLAHSHILAMQGPFSQALNEAVFRQWNIRWMVTKDGGRNGGFAEKLAAAQNCGVGALVLTRPEDQGETVEGILARFAAWQPAAPALQPIRI